MPATKKKSLLVWKKVSDQCWKSECGQYAIAVFSKTKWKLYEWLSGREHKGSVRYLKGLAEKWKRNPL